MEGDAGIGVVRGSDGENPGYDLWTQRQHLIKEPLRARQQRLQVDAFRGEKKSDVVVGMEEGRRGRGWQLTGGVARTGRCAFARRRIEVGTAAARERTKGLCAGASGQR